MEQQEKKRKTWVRILIWTLSVLVIAAVAAVVILCRDDLSLSGIQSRLSRLFSRDAMAQEISYDGGEHSVVRTVDGGLAVVNETGLSFYSDSGALLFSRSLELGDPAVSVSGAYGLMYDVGGTSAAVFTSEGVKAAVSVKEKILYASVNKDGWFAVCTAETTYTSSATVYEPDGTAAYKWYSADGYAASAAVSPDDRSLAVCVYGEGGSTVVCMDLNSTDEVSRTAFSGALVLELWWSGTDALTAVTPSGVTAFGKDGTVNASTDLDASRLTAYARGDSFTVLGGSGYQGSGTSTVMVVSDGGDVLGEAEMDGQISFLSVCGGNIAVLCGSTVRVYNNHMEQLSLYGGADGAKAVQARSDGTALAVGDYYAWLLDAADLKPAE